MEGFLHRQSDLQKVTSYCPKCFARLLTGPAAALALGAFFFFLLNGGGISYLTQLISSSPCRRLLGFLFGHVSKKFAQKTGVAAHTHAFD